MTQKVPDLLIMYRSESGLEQEPIKIDDLLFQRQKKGSRPEGMTEELIKASLEESQETENIPHAQNVANSNQQLQIKVPEGLPLHKVFTQACLSRAPHSSMPTTCYTEASKGVEGPSS